MDLKLLATKAFTLIVPVLKSKAAKTICEDFTEAINNEIIDLWENKLKKIFIITAKKQTETLEKEPDNKNAQEDLTNLLKMALENDEDLQKKIYQLTEKVENEKPGYIKKHNILTVSGDGAIGIQDSNNVHIKNSGNYNTYKDKDNK